MQIEQIPAVADWLIHSGEFLGFCVVGWKVIARLNREETLKKDYPPHKHIGEVIIYPNEYPPAKTEKLP